MSIILQYILFKAVLDLKQWEVPYRNINDFQSHISNSQQKKDPSMDANEVSFLQTTGESDVTLTPNLVHTVHCKCNAVVSHMQYFQSLSFQTTGINDTINENQLKSCQVHACLDFERLRVRVTRCCKIPSFTSFAEGLLYFPMQAQYRLS